MGIRILVLTNHLTGFGGTEKVISTVVNELQRDKDIQEIEVVVADQLTSTDWMNNFLKKTIFQKSKFSKLGRIGQLLFLLKKLTTTEANIVISTSPKLIHIAKKITKFHLRKYKVVSWLHYPLDSPFLIGKINEICEADYHLTIAKKISEQLRGIISEPDNIFTIFNPVEKCNTVVNKSIENKFIYIGRLDYPKNVISLLEAVKIASNKASFTLDIFGNGPDKSKLIEFSKNNNLTKIIHFKDWVDNPWDEIVEATSLVLTSEFEGFGLVLAEAFSRGLPVLSSVCEIGPKELVKKSNGVLYQNGNINDLSDKIIQFCENKYSFDQNEIKKSIEEMYTDNYFKKLKLILEKILS